MEEIIVSVPPGKGMDVSSLHYNQPEDNSIVRSLDTYNRDISEMNPSEQYVEAFDPKSNVYSINSTQAENVQGPIVYEDESISWGQYLIIGVILYFITNERFLK